MADPKEPQRLKDITERFPTDCPQDDGTCGDLEGPEYDAEDDMPDAKDDLRI